MRQRFFIFGKPRWAAAAAWLVLATPLWAASNIIAPAPEYQAADQLTTVNPNGYDVFGDQAAVYADGHLELYNRNTWSPVCNLGDAGYGGLTTAYNSFVKFDPSGQSVWVGYTVGGDTNDRIYQVTNLGATPTWNYVATMPSNYDLAFSGTTPYVSGPNSTTLGAENCIWRMNPTTGQFTEVAAVGGFAAGIAFDAAGNLYYGTDSYTDNKLLEFPAAQVSAAGQALAQPTILSNLPGWGSGVAVNGAGHVLFAVNGSTTSTLGIWNGTQSEADNYRVIGTGGADWYVTVRALGDVTTTGGAAYLNNWYEPGLAEIHHLLPGDANGDGVVNGVDLNTVLSNYNKTFTGDAWAYGDFDGNDVVNGVDLNTVLSQYNQSAGVGAAVPEPSTLALLAIGALAATAWRRIVVRDS